MDVVLKFTPGKFHIKFYVKHTLARNKVFLNLPKSASKGSVVIYALEALLQLRVKLYSGDKLTEEII